MTHPHVTQAKFFGSLIGVVVCAVVSSASGPARLAGGSEVISAIPGTAQPPITPGMVVETIEAGTRGPGPAPHHRRHERCAGGHCAAERCGHAGCRQGTCDVPGCPAHCPVRPASFGFYGTQWRTWPGQQVIQAAHTEPAAPVMPPKSEVPTADEESPVPGFELPAPAAEDPAAAAQEPTLLEPADSESTPRAPMAEEPAPLPGPGTAPGSVKPDAPAEDKPAEDNLFDEATLRRRSQERLAMLGQAAAQQERVRLEALRQQAQRLVRPAAVGSSAAAIRPPVAAGPIADRGAGPAALALPASEDREPPSLRQAVHAEPEPRGLRAARTPLQGNPLR